LFQSALDAAGTDAVVPNISPTTVGGRAHVDGDALDCTLSWDLLASLLDAAPTVAAVPVKGKGKGKVKAVKQVHACEFCDRGFGSKYGLSGHKRNCGPFLVWKVSTAGAAAHKAAKTRADTVSRARRRAVKAAAVARCPGFKKSGAPCTRPGGFRKSIWCGHHAPTDVAYPPVRHVNAHLSVLV
jgi:hypothetical protein